MEPNQFQKHVIERLQKLEGETFEGTFEENYGSARERGELDQYHKEAKIVQMLVNKYNLHRLAEELMR